MPLYDFECPHRHRFERLCTMAKRLELVPCEGKVNQLVLDDELVAKHKADPTLPLPEGCSWSDMEVGVDPAEGSDVQEIAGTIQDVMVREVPCILKAKLVVGTHNNPAGSLDHGLAANRDAAREGRYDPLNPVRRGLSKGRGYRK